MVVTVKRKIAMMAIMMVVARVNVIIRTCRSTKNI